MAKHTDILEAFTAKMMEHSIEGAAIAIRGGIGSSESADSMLNGTTPTITQLTDIFEEDEESHALTMVVLLKMCDISTEIRPDGVAQPWLKGLIDELSSQVSGDADPAYRTSKRGALIFFLLLFSETLSGGPICRCLR